MADRLEMFVPTRGFSGMADSMEPCKMLWGRPLLIWARRADPVAYRLVDIIPSLSRWSVRGFFELENKLLSTSFMSPLRRHIFVCFMAKSAFFWGGGEGVSALAPYTRVGPI